MPPRKFLLARFYKADFPWQSIPGSIHFRTYIQQLSHQTIEGYFLYIRAKKMPVIEGFEPVPVSRLPRLAFPVSSAATWPKRVSHVKEKMYL